MDLRAIGVRGWLLIAGALTLGAGTSLGVLASTYIVHGARARERLEEHRPAVGPVLNMNNSNVYERVGLSDAQRRQADTILGDHFLKLVGLRQQREALVKKLEEDLNGILDDGQRERMQEIKVQVRYSETMEAVLQKVSSYRLDLDLTPEQEDKVYSIFLADQFKKDELQKDRSLSSDEKRKRYLLLSEERAAKLRPVLGEEQWKRFRAIEEKKRAFMNGRGNYFRGAPCPPAEGQSSAPAGSPPVPRDRVLQIPPSAGPSASPAPARTRERSR